MGLLGHVTGKNRGNLRSLLPPNDSFPAHRSVSNIGKKIGKIRQPDLGHPSQRTLPLTGTRAHEVTQARDGFWHPRRGDSLRLKFTGISLH